MAFVIGPACIDAQDRSCMDVCPVDCIYEGGRKTYINPTECIDCGACELACPEVAIFPARRAKGDETRESFRDGEVEFFSTVLPGRSEPLGNPGGAEAFGVVGVDIPLVADWDA
ncbi:indolepyruvate ferredoxin oxidoreductase subunit alpha [Cellulomonas soli]